MKKESCVKTSLGLYNINIRVQIVPLDNFPGLSFYFKMSF